MTKAKYRRVSRLCSLVGKKKKKALFVFAKSHSEGTHKKLTTRGAGVGTGMWGTYRAEVVASQWAPVGCLSMLFSGVQSRDPAPQQVLDSVTTRHPKNLMSLSSGSKLPLWLVS